MKRALILLLVLAVLAVLLYRLQRTDTGPTAGEPGASGTAASASSEAAGGAGSATAALPATPPAPLEAAVRDLPLAGPMADRLAEVSSLTRLGADFILLPQYPGRFGADGKLDEDQETRGEGQLFALSLAEVEAALDGGEGAAALTPRPVPFTAPPAVTGLEGFEGFEAIAFLEDQVFVTIETQDDEATRGFVAAGRIEQDAEGRLTAVRLDEAAPVEVPLPANLDNMSLESLLVTPAGLLTFFEANGAKVNPQPQDQRLGFDLSLKEQVPFPTVEYRITDVTELDADGCFWAVNYLFPGDAETLQPADDAIAARWGKGPTHAGFPQVERLLPFCYAEGRLSLAEQAPIQLQLVDAETSRNWEGIERVEDRGFLLVTDKFPGTQLGFVAMP